MSTPQAKRRRLNTAAKTLNKPFKSPFHTPLKPDPASDTRSSSPPDIAIPQAASRNSIASADPQPQQTKPTPRPISTPFRQRKTPATPQTKPKTSPSLTREIISLRSDIQILSQALSLSTSTKDADLEILVDRWRVASRAAAEELFAGTRDRVNGMGGVGAWKSREKEQAEWRGKWEKEEQEAEQERRREKIEELRDEGKLGEDWEERIEEREGSREVKVEEKVGEGGNDDDDDSFTMDMMLKTLNIDIKLIGYDKEGQRWEG